MTLEQRKKKLAYAEQMAAQHERRLSLALTCLKKWNRRIRSLEKQIAAEEITVAVAKATHKQVNRRFFLEEVK